MVDMAHLIDSQSNLPTTFIDGGCQKNPSETSDRADFELRKKRFQEQHADWFFLQKKHFEEHGLWCEGLIPWMSADVDSLAAD